MGAEARRTLHSSCLDGMAGPATSRRNRTVLAAGRMDEPPAYNHQFFKRNQHAAIIRHRHLRRNRRAEERTALRGSKNALADRNAMNGGMTTDGIAGGAFTHGWSGNSSV